MNNKNLHQKQRRILNLLIKNYDNPLTIREIQSSLGMSSTSVVSHHLMQLEKKGYLKRNPSNPRDYHIIKSAPEKQIIYLNLYGMAHCGPHGSLLDGNPIDRIPISPRLLSFPASEGFLLKAKGDSMEPKIYDNDLIIAKRSNTVENGKITICTNKGEVLLKKIHQQKEGIFLISLNQKYIPFLAADDFKIVGEVKGIISYTL